MMVKGSDMATFRFSHVIDAFLCLVCNVDIYMNLACTAHMGDREMFFFHLRATYSMVNAMVTSSEFTGSYTYTKQIFGYTYTAG